MILLGSLAFGLSATNAVYLYYLWADTDYDDSAFSISLGGDVVENVTSNTLTIDISHGMALLWTVGAAAHSFLDLTLWHMIACSYGCRKIACCKVAGWNLAVATVMILVAVTSFVVVVRAYEAGEEEIQQHNNTSINGIDTTFGFGDGQADFRYLYGYLIELVLSLFVYTPLVQILLFTGICGCGALPVLGGRPYEVRKSNRSRNNRGEKNGVDNV